MWLSWQFKLRVHEGQILINPGRLTFWGTENPLLISVFTYYSFQIKLSSFWEVSHPKFHIWKNDDKVGNKTNKENKKEGNRRRLHAGNPTGTRPLVCLACLPRARPFSLSPTTSKRLLRRVVTSHWQWWIGHRQTHENNRDGPSLRVIPFSIFH